MSPDDPDPAATLRVVITDEIGRPLRKPSLARWLQAIAPGRARGQVTLALVTDAGIRRLNRRYAGVNRATDVLSFLDRGPGRHLGDIAIATGAAARQAREAGHSLDTELRVLALHGLLHLLGYDHESDDGKMARLERRLRRKGGLEEGLIDRAATGDARLGSRSVQRRATARRARRAKAGLPRRSALVTPARAKAGRRAR